MAHKAKKKVRPTGEGKTDSVLDRTIDHLFMVLPATTRQEIASKISSRMRRDVTVGDVDNALGHLRSNPDKYGWTIPHVKRAIPVEGIDENRFFAALVNGDGSLEYDHAEQSEHVRRGFESTMRSTATQHANEASAIEVIAPKLPPELTRKARKLARLLAGISQEERLLLEDLSAFGKAA